VWVNDDTDGYSFFFFCLFEGRKMTSAKDCTTPSLNHPGLTFANYLHTPHLPPSLAQCLQYLQFLQALHDLEPVQVADAL